MHWSELWTAAMTRAQCIIIKIKNSIVSGLEQPTQNSDSEYKEKRKPKKQQGMHIVVFK